MPLLNRLLIVDDDFKDMRHAHDVALSLGFSDIEGRTSADEAYKFLGAALTGKCLLPDAIIVDLNLGSESGYELLRNLHSNPELASIPVIVWSYLGEHQRELCALFRVRSFVTKGDKEYSLRDALADLESTRLGSASRPI